MTDIQARPATLHLLLVEDDDGDAVLVEELLSDAGLAAEVTRAWSLEAAVDALTMPVDCVLLDLGLPDATGLDALVQLRDATDAAVVVLTGLDDADHGLEAVGAGAQDYLVKGTVEADALGRAVRYAVERRRGDRERQVTARMRARAVEVAQLAQHLRPEPHVPSAPVRVVLRGDEDSLCPQLGDVVERPDGTVLVVAGTAEGSGTDAAALAATVRAAFRALALSALPAGEVVDALDRVVAARTDTDTDTDTDTGSVQAVIIEMLPATRAVVCHLADHHAPLVTSTGEVKPLVATAGRGAPLGAGQGPRPAVATQLHDQDRLLVLHNGVLALAGDGSPDDSPFAGVLTAATKGVGDETGLADTVERVVRAYGPGGTEVQFFLLDWTLA